MLMRVRIMSLFILTFWIVAHPQKIPSLGIRSRNSQDQVEELSKLGNTMKTKYGEYLMDDEPFLNYFNKDNGVGSNKSLTMLISQLADHAQCMSEVPQATRMVNGSARYNHQGRLIPAPRGSVTSSSSDDERREY
ncbi:hypothetical protein GE061_002955 [Apolygus lucorum]|uniref:Uncharacterized protein n=1 Tax=Apolygus lucorum TaxID=248454 RepID=A0A6A4JDH3_APOLU|nr:hypothetical protein GE061_002955 [Apolygus lucorum]